MLRGEFVHIPVGYIDLMMKKHRFIAAAYPHIIEGQRLVDSGQAGPYKKLVRTRKIHHEAYIFDTGPSSKRAWKELEYARRAEGLKKSGYLVSS